MKIAIVENGIISNIIVAPDGSNPESFGGIDLQEGLWIGDKIPDSIDTPIEHNPEPEEPAPTPEERIAALEEENHLLSQQVTALTDQNDFQEELIVELANIVYA